MEENRDSNGPSWAEQWDYNSKPAPATPKRVIQLGGGSGTAKYKQKVGEGLDKTKTVASHGVKKVKEGTSVGIQWIKDKYNKSSQKH